MGSTMRIALGLIGMAISLIIFPIVLTAAASIMENANIGNYTGLSDVVGISPLVLLVGLLFGSGASVYSGIKKRKKTKKSQVSKY